MAVPAPLTAELRAPIERLVPPDAFTLEHGDEIRITIEPVGTLTNTVA